MADLRFCAQTVFSVFSLEKESYFPSSLYLILSKFVSSILWLLSCGDPVFFYFSLISIFFYFSRHLSLLGSNWKLCFLHSWWVYILALSWAALGMLAASTSNISKYNLKICSLAFCFLGSIMSFQYSWLLQTQSSCSPGQEIWSYSYKASILPPLMLEAMKTQNSHSTSAFPHSWIL